MRRPAHRLAILLVLAACASVFGDGCNLFGGQTGQEDKSAPDPCGLVPIRNSDDEEDGGVAEASPADVADALRGPFSATLAWNSQRPATQVAIALSYAGSGARRTYDVACNVLLELPVTLSISTADGLLDEHVAATLSATSPDAGTLWATIPLEALAGSYDASDVLGANPSNPELRIQIELSNSMTFGHIALSTYSTSGDSKNGNGSSFSDVVANWPAAQ